ncbi:phosphatidate cytidylyltransferase [uncultured Rhodoblastus sp.]|uniref:phosphatidate cytidylyltransferase n=1 Tax=uncultured Rhodoblastus sp. TaxID=543037 RepID=UPI0025E2FF65|nr:phosphatidate cytidylyltransferase [uncultured Rhodoblastus sp.]
MHEAGIPPDSPPGLMARHQLGDLWLRAFSALILVAAAIFALVMGGSVFIVFWLVAALAVHGEWQRLIGAPLPWARLFGGGLALVLTAGLHRFGQSEQAFLLLPLAAGFCAWAAGPGFRLWAAAGVFYAGGLLMAMLLLRPPPFFGACAIGWLFAVVWGTDVFAYFGGRLVGGPKLCPAISPGKTWSGLFIGVFCGAVMGAVTAHLWPDVNAPVWPVFGLGLVAGAVAQGGDLLESWVKRHFHVKDSSQLIPGHGGFMDRLDGFIAAAIFAAVFGLWHAQPSAAAGLFHWP